MRKIIALIVLLTFIIKTSPAQTIYAGLEGGPKWTFNGISGTKSLIKTTADMRARVGARAGVIMNDDLRFEVGLYYNPLSVAFEFSDPKAYFSNFTMSTLQIPIRVKKKVYSDNNSMNIYASLGIVPNLRLSTSPKAPWDSTVVADGTGDTLVLNSSINYFGKSSFMMAELGVSLEYELNDNLYINFNITGQTSFTDIIVTTLSYSRNNASAEITNLTTRGLGAYVEMGFIYLLNP